MPSVTYNISFTSGTSQDLKAGNTLNTFISRDGEVSSGAKILSASIYFSDITVHTRYEPYLKFDTYFSTEPLQQKSSGGSMTARVTSISSSIQEVSSDSFKTTVMCSASTNMLNIKGDATLIIEYEETYTASTGTLSKSSLNAGGTLTVTIANEKLADLNHKIKVTLSSNTPIETTSGVGVSTASIKIPLSWSNAVPRSTSATGTVAITTYSGTSYIGSKSYSFTMTIPESAKPTVGSLSAAIVNNNVPSGWGVYVQNKSGVTLTASSVTTSYSSPISRYTFTMTANGSTTTLASQTSPTFTQTEITGYGSVVFKVTATDARGRVSTAVSKTITVEQYSAPAFTATTAGRCTSSGSSSEEGTYINARAVYTHSAVGGKNTASQDCYYRRNGDTSWSTGKTSMVSGTSYIVGGGNVNTAYSYQVRFVIADSFGSVEKIVNLSTTSYSIFIRDGGTGVGIGKVCEHENAFEINPNWSFMYGDKDIAAMLNRNNIVFTSANNSSTPAGTTGMIWLKEKR